MQLPSLQMHKVHRNQSLIITRGKGWRVIDTSQGADETMGALLHERKRLIALWC